ncbi:hypothetical protein ACLOJK_026561 [Asimina triloba]
MCPSERHSRPEMEPQAYLRPAFDVLDTDHDGKISPDDLRAFYTGAGAGASDDDIGSMISAADSNKDGFVQFEEFETIVGGKKAAAAPGGVMEDVFRVMDRDGDGKVGFGDLRDYMNWAGLRASDDEIKAMIKMGGGDAREGVCFDGLVKILTVDLGAGPRA